MKIGDEYKICHEVNGEIETVFVTDIKLNRFTGCHTVTMQRNTGAFVHYDFDVSGQPTPHHDNRKWRILNKDEHKFDGEIKVIRKIDVHPDDVIVYKSENTISMKDHRRVQVGLKHFFPNNKILICGPHEKLSVVAPVKEDEQEEKT